MSVRTAVANAAIAASAAPGAYRWWRATTRVRETQERLWTRIRDRNRDSAYGRAHGFASRPALADLASLPVMTADDLVAARAARGRPCDLTADPIVRVVPTSGTSGGRKDVPYTGELLAEFQAGLDPWLFSMYRRYPQLLAGRAYWQVTPTIRAAGAEVDAGSGDDTEYMGRFRAGVMRRVLAVPADVGAAPDLETFRWRTLRHLVRCSDLAFVSVWNPSFLALLLDAVPLLLARLDDDLRRDGLTHRADELRGAVESGTGEPASRDARGRTWPERLWPRLHVVSCWADANAAGAAAALQARLPSVTLEPKGLLATEGIVTLPWARGVHALALTSHVFEFVSESGEGGARCADQLERGRSYRVLLTTGGGLYRYALGDVVEVTGHVNACPVLRFVGRHDGVVDLVGEKLSPVQVQRAVTAGLAAAGCVARFWMVAPAPAAGGVPRYTLFLQGGPLDEAGATRLLDAIESTLSENPHYAYARVLGQLGGMHLFEIAAGEDPDARVLARLSEHRKLGAIKPPVLDARSDWAGAFSGADVPRHE